MVFGVPVFRRDREMLRLRPHLLSGDQCDVGVDFMLSPFPYKCFVWRSRNHDDIRCALKPLQRLAHARERGGGYRQSLQHFRSHRDSTPSLGSVRQSFPGAVSIADCSAGLPSFVPFPTILGGETVLVPQPPSFARGGISRKKSHTSRIALNRFVPRVFE